MHISSSKNQTSLVINKNELSTKFNEIKKIISKNIKNQNFVIVVSCDLTDVGSVPYSYRPDEVDKLIYINNLFEQYGHTNRVLFSEGIDLTSNNLSNRKIHCWALPIVLEVNKKIDRIVQKIKDLRLTPYETVLYIHQLASKIQYSCKAEANTLSREAEATVLGLSDKFKHLCCVGYASFVKAIIDKLDTPDLAAEVRQFQIFQTSKKTDDHDFIVAHATNMIYINDCHYGIKGVYFEDATPFAAPQTDFSACLVPIPDLQHYRGRVYRQFPLKNSIDNIHKQINVDGKAFYNIQGRTEDFRNNFLKLFYEYLPFQDPKTHQFTKNLKYTQYTIRSFQEAYTSLLEKLNEKDIAQAVTQAIDCAVECGGKYFDKTAENCYTKESLATKNRLKDENNGL